MKKIFISQPMNGLSNEEIKVIRLKLALMTKVYLQEEVLIIDSFFENQPADKPIEALGKAISLMQEADYFVTMQGNDSFRGCMIERFVAEQYIGSDRIIEFPSLYFRHEAQFYDGLGNRLEG